jgi:NAD(P)-dependent dehydrogenase (short-subunit alcohol dehydrogenase family)
MMQSLPDQFHTLIIGSSGAIGQAFDRLISAEPRSGQMTRISRQSEIAMDLTDSASIAQAALVAKAQAPYHLILVCTGILHSANLMPEKKLGDLDQIQMQTIFQINTIGPALILKNFTELLAKDRSIFCFISAKVGSIEDNRLGGWYSYRASKAALNMVLKTGAIEIARNRPNTNVVAMHPGTVNSPLSAPFGGAEKGQDPLHAAEKMLHSLDQLQPNKQATFLSYDGSVLPW